MMTNTNEQAPSKEILKTQLRFTVAQVIISFIFFLLFAFLGYLIFENIIPTPVRDSIVAQSRHLLLNRFLSIHLHAPSYGYISPHVKENMIFLLSVLCTPVYLLLSCLLTKYLSKHAFYMKALNKAKTALITGFMIAFIAILVFTLSGSGIPTLLAWQPSHDVFFYYLIVFLASSMLTFLALRTWKSNLYINSLKALVVVFILLNMLFIIVTSRLISFDDYLALDLFVRNIEAVLYPVVQVMLGKNLLVNLPSQYGLYPILLKPYFLLFGFSIFKFSFLMGLLMAISLLSLFLALIRLSKNYVLTLIFMLSIFIITGQVFTLIKSGSILPYYQYFPIRFLFPALSLPVFIWLCRRMNITAMACFGILAAVACIWNFESGVPILLAFLAYLLVQFLLPVFYCFKLQKRIINLIVALCFILAVFLAFYLYVELTATGVVHWSWLFKFDHVFYHLGVMEISLPIGLSLWMVVLSVYAFSLTFVLYNWLIKVNTPLLSFVFYLSLLGIGLFMYYQYRALPTILITCSWPAWFICFIASAKILEGIRNKTLPKALFCLALLIIFLGLSVGCNYLFHLNLFVKTGQRLWQNHDAAIVSKQPMFTQSVKFIEENTNGSKDVYVLGPNQTFIYWLLKIPSPVDGPGASQLFLKESLEKQVAAIIRKRVQYVFIFSDTNYKLPAECAPLLKYYKIRKALPYIEPVYLYMHKLYLLTPRGS